MKKTKDYFLEYLDSDKCPKALDFYKEYWYKTLGNTINFILYGGECIFTFKTIAGCYIRCLPGFVFPDDDYEGRLDYITNKRSDVEPYERYLFKRFFEVGNTRANFMPLPKPKPSLPAYSLNMIKGNANGPYNDFPDLFYKDWLGGKLTNVLSYQSNKEYYQKFDGGKWDSFIRYNYLDDLFTDDTFSICKQVAPDSSIKMPFNKTSLSKMNNNDKLLCRKYICCHFLPTAIEILEKRAERLSAITAN